MAMLDVVTREGDGSVAIDARRLERLMAALGGPCLTADDAGYDDARVIWNGLIDRRPAIIAQCSDTSDVVEAVNFAREHDLRLAVRGGGHNVAGNAMCDGGIVIDLSRMNDVRIDTEARRVRAQGGAIIRDVDRASLAAGLAVPLGVVSQTGIGGLTLCGGHSWLARKYGFACDALVSAEVVTADGRRLDASHEQHPDLFWAIRGGGGNFGIVTTFEYEAYSVGPDVAFCAPFFPLEDAAGIFRGWRDFTRDAPDEYTGNFNLWSVPEIDHFPQELHGREVVIPAGVCIGPIEDGQRIVQPVRELGEPLIDLSGPTPYGDVQQGFDPVFGKGERFNYWKSLYLEDLPDEAIDRIVARALDRPSPWALITVRNMGGAMSRVPSDATALGNRSAPYLLSIDTSWTDPDGTDAAIAWTRDFWSEMRRFSDGGVYLNFPGEGEEGERLLRASYGDANYERLVGIKTKYDPDNLFRLNQNIPPGMRQP